MTYNITLNITHRSCLCRRHRMSMSETQNVYVRDRECLCPRHRVSMSRTDHIYVRDRKYPCPRPKVSMSQTESVYVPDRECLCPRQRVFMSQTESVDVPDRKKYRFCKHKTGHNSGSWPPLEIKSSALDRIFHAWFASNIFAKGSLQDKVVLGF